jgi:hypothetical protein
VNRFAVSLHDHPQVFLCCGNVYPALGASLQAGFDGDVVVYGGGYLGHMLQNLGVLVRNPIFEIVGDFDVVASRHPTNMRKNA